MYQEKTHVCQELLHMRYLQIYMCQEQTHMYLEIIHMCQEPSHMCQAFDGME